MNFEQIFSDIFGKFGKYFTNRLSIIIPSMMRCSSCNLSTITTNLAYFQSRILKQMRTEFTDFLRVRVFL